MVRRMKGGDCGCGAAKPTSTEPFKGGADGTIGDLDPSLTDQLGSLKGSATMFAQSGGRGKRKRSSRGKRKGGSRNLAVAPLMDTESKPIHGFRNDAFTADDLRQRFVSAAGSLSGRGPGDVEKGFMPYDGAATKHDSVGGAKKKSKRKSKRSSKKGSKKGKKKRSVGLFSWLKGVGKRKGGGKKSKKSKKSRR